MGFGISAGEFIWVVLPFVDSEKKANADTWWGDESATINYAITNVPKICLEYGGDPEKVILCGFSRGAIGVSYIGLHDDQISSLWSGFVTHDHFDGLKEWKGTAWGSPLDSYRKHAAERLERLNDRPVLICQNGQIESVKKYLSSAISRESQDGITLLSVNTQSILGRFPNEYAVHPHNDVWMRKDSEARREVWRWVKRVVE